MHKDHRQGDLDAPSTLVEYGDYQCPSCRQAYPIVKRVQKHFGKRLLFVFRNFPLSEMHPYAEPAAETAEFAGAHHKFWEMHDLLMRIKIAWTMRSCFSWHSNCILIPRSCAKPSHEGV